MLQEDDRLAGERLNTRSDQPGRWSCSWRKLGLNVEKGPAKSSYIGQHRQTGPHLEHELPLAVEGKLLDS
jgi:hypothetical protein